MSRAIKFTPTAWEHYSYWQKQDKQVLHKINRLISEVQRSPFSGIGKPEPLKDNLAGFWSRRITDEHRLVYAVTDAEVQIISCQYHYGDR